MYRKLDTRTLHQGPRVAALEASDPLYPQAS
jgi:hypothetical protein